MAYKHGIYIQENPTALNVPVSSPSAIQFVVGTAPINLLTTPADAVNKPILIENYDQVASRIGYSDDWAKFTLCQSIFASFKVYAVTPIVLVNVLDPATHVTSVLATEIDVVNKKATLEIEGVLIDTVVVKSGDGLTTYDIADDYTIAFNDVGQVEITLVVGGAAEAETSLTINHDELDPTQVTNADIIAGIQKVQEVYQTLNVIPGLLLAPSYSQIPAIGQELLANCENIGGLFSANAILDLDSSTVTTYDAVKAEKDTNLYNVKHAIVCWPKVTYNSKTYYMSAMLGAHIGKVDIDNDGVPYVSPSNKSVFVDSLVLESDTEVILTFTKANALNADGVITCLNMNGFKIWGNNTGAYPESIDPKDRFIPVRRMFDWWGNTFITTYFNRVDDPLNRKLIESIVDDENIRANGFKARFQIAEAGIEFRISDNPVEELSQGKIVFRQTLTPYPPVESITNILEFDPNALAI